MVSPLSSTVASIRTKVRRLTGEHSALQLPDSVIDEHLQAAYTQDMPADIKSNLFREVVEVYAVPNVDRYALSGTLSDNQSANVFEGLGEPCYVEGRTVPLFRDRGQFYATYPKTTSLSTALAGDGVTVAFSLTLSFPVLQNEITIGTIEGGTPINYYDDGDPLGTGTGTIYQTGTTATSRGTIVYATGVLTFNPIAAPDASTQISVWYYPYSASRPASLLWWRNELIVRPVPDRVYKIEVEAYRYPSQFTADNETPELKQWFQYLSFLTSMKILQERQDIEGMQNIDPSLRRQEVLIRNRIANAQIGQRNVTIYEGADTSPVPFFQGWF